MVTAVLNAHDSNKKPIPCRALIDTCSTANFITNDFAKTLRLPKKNCSLPVTALNGLGTQTNFRVTVEIKSRLNGFSRTLSFLTVSNIASNVPECFIDRAALSIPANLRLADPEFHKPAPVNMLIGAGTALSLLSIGQINLSSPGGPDLYLQKTQLGWVIGGSVVSNTLEAHTDTPVCHLTETPPDLAALWEIEEGPAIKRLSKREQECENHYNEHTIREADGRYTVALPFRSSHEGLGTSREAALKRLRGLEKRFVKNKELHQQYSSIIQDYIDHGYLTKAKDPREEGFYLPHHPVFKATSLTTKTRIVFDGSAESNTGVSLNAMLMTGPTIQDDIFSIVLRFRTHNYVLTGDIEKMYLQVVVRPEDRKFQRILWRDENGDIITYELNRVTFGLSASPFLAIRTLHQLANDEEQQHPIAARILKRDVYVDDLLTGGATIEEAITIRNEMITLLQRGGFNLRQCASNEPKILNGLTDQSINLQLQSTDDHTLKTLGVYWNSQQDALIYTIKQREIPCKLTKRIILSEIARIFDPLGLLQPIIVTAKIILQRLWKLEISWDESVPNSIHTEWTDFISQLGKLSLVSFQRKIILADAQLVELHGFCDASERAYGACIYLRSVDSSGATDTQLLCAKSRVAPIKKLQTIPRLELCGARLLIDLHTAVTAALNIKIDRSVFWTDSTITLHWINTSPHSLKTFVANRVAEIQAHASSENWRHVRTHDNPADQISRGYPPGDWSKNSLWKNGPEWLQKEEQYWPHLDLPTPPDDEERKKISCFSLSVQDHDELFKRYSSIHKLRRVIAYCLRLKVTNHFKGPIKAQELAAANHCIVRMVQSSAFSQEIRNLKENKQLHPKSKLLSLHPYVDELDILRVGGRLHNSNISHDERHPILIPKNSPITDLIIENEHRTNGHAGTQTTLYAVRRQYWLIDGRNQVRKKIRQCVKCTRASPPTVEYLMGQLPKERVNPSLPFTNVGIDYCGPFYIKEKRFRNRTKIKVYVAVFVCLSVKAIHLELVSDMTTDGFIAALRRFIARRGKPRTISSDNGSNFVGANNELRDIQSLLKSNEHNTQVENFLAEGQIKWNFIPPQSPHFGGIWEAAVKSFKHHMRRIIGLTLLCFEDFNTLIIEIESILNSRPITPLSSDPNDPLALTPGHFLIGRSLTSFPDHDLMGIETNRLSTWQHVERMKQHFWKRWSKEYVNELNLLKKWTRGHHAIDVGSIVVIRDDNAPPLRWLMGRVIETYPGADGIIRTVRLKTASGVLDRTIKKLAPLPIESIAAPIKNNI